jgi:hypothetical protein
LPQAKTLVEKVVRRRTILGYRRKEAAHRVGVDDGHWRSGNEESENLRSRFMTAPASRGRQDVGGSSIETSKIAGHASTAITEEYTLVGLHR